jgi:hypothetical protein
MGWLIYCRQKNITPAISSQFTIAKNGQINRRMQNGNKKNQKNLARAWHDEKTTYQVFMISGSILSCSVRASTFAETAADTCPPKL